MSAFLVELSPYSEPSSLVTEQISTDSKGLIPPPATVSAAIRSPSLTTRILLA
jgi:hypothetical protein